MSRYARPPAVGVSAGSYSLVILVALLYATPLAVWLIRLVTQEPDGRLATNLYFALLEETLLFSSGATAIAIAMTVPVSVLFVFSGFGTRRVLRILMTIPLVIGFLARNYSWIGLLSTPTATTGSTYSLASVITDTMLYRPTGVLLVLATVFIPFSFFILTEGFSAIQGHQLDAARTLGLSESQVMLWVVLPAGTRAMFLATGVIFVLAIGYFVTPRMIGGGKGDFVGNAAIVFLDLGRVADASVVAAYLFVTACIPMAFVLQYALRRRSRVMGG